MIKLVVNILFFRITYINKRCKTWNYFHLHFSFVSEFPLRMNTTMTIFRRNTVIQKTKYERKALWQFWVSLMIAFHPINFKLSLMCFSSRWLVKFRKKNKGISDCIFYCLGLAYTTALTTGYGRARGSVRTSTTRCHPNLQAGKPAPPKFLCSKFCRWFS